MIEAASSVLQTASATQPLSRQVAADTSTVAATPVSELQADVASVSEVPLLNIEVSTKFDTAVLEIRRTGAASEDVEQIPDEKVLEARKREKAAKAAEAAPSKTTQDVEAFISETSSSVEGSTEVSVEITTAEPTVSAQTQQQVAAFNVAQQAASSAAPSESTVSVLA